MLAVGCYYSIVCCILRGNEAVDAMRLDGCDAVWSKLASFFVICPFCVALYLKIYLSERAMDAVGNAAELPGWLARVHEVLIDMFDTLFFCMINCFANEDMIKSLHLGSGISL